MKLDPRLIRLALSARSAFLAALALGFAGGVLTILQARGLTVVLDEAFLRGGALLSVQGWLIGLTALALLRFAASWLTEIAAQRAAARAQETLRARLLEHFFALGPMTSLDKEKDDNTGERLTLLTEGIDSLEAYFAQYLPQVFWAAAIPLTILAFIFPLDPLSGLILLLTGPLIPLFMALIGSQAEKQTRRQWQSLGRLSARFLDAIQGLPARKLLGQSRAYAPRLAQTSESYRQQTMTVLRISFLSALALEWLSTLSTALVAVQIGLRLLYGYLSFEQAFFVLLLTPEFYLPLRLLGLRFHAGMSGAAAGEKIFQALAIPAKTQPGAPALHRIPHPASHIAFEHVSYTYPNGTRALDDVSFTLRAGKITAVLGPSGAGKSTLAALFLGFIQPTSGVIHNLPSTVSYLPQRPYLFADTAAANLRLARPEASDEELIAAARLAHADEFIRTLPLGYATPIGERGLRLSGGQAQRIALARAFLQPAPLILLDEPTSQLDAESERLAAEALRRLAENRILLIITHRPQTAARAHAVIRLQAGRATEEHPAAAGHNTEQNPPLEQQRRPNPAPIAEQNATHTPGLSETKPGDLLPLLRFLRPFAMRVGVSVLLGAAAIAAGIGLIGASAYIIAAAALRPSVAALSVAIVGVRFFGLSRGLFRYLERLISHDVTFRVLGRLRTWFYGVLEARLPLLGLHSGDFLGRAVGEINALENFYVRAVAPPFSGGMAALGSVALLGRIAPGLGIALWGFLALGGLLLPLGMRLASRGPSRVRLAARSRLNVSLVDALQGMPDLLALGAAERQCQRVMDHSGEAAAAHRRLAMLSGLQSAAMGMITNGALIALLILAIPLVYAGIIEGVLLPVLALIALSSFEAVQPLPLAAQHLAASLQSAQRLSEIEALPQRSPEPAQPAMLPASFDLRVNDLSFAYPGGAPILSNVSFHLPPGKRMRLTGASGAGKTTLLNLLLRLWELPNPAAVRLNGLTLNDFSPEALRRGVSVVPQNPYLFCDSLRENLRLARPDASDEQLWDALEQAQLASWARTLRDGLDTWVGEHGVRLSGGERQRVALARAFLRGAPFWLLDEPTAHLDPQTERAVWAALRRATAGASVLCATHTAEPLDWMDEVYDLDHRG